MSNNIDKINYFLKQMLDLKKNNILDELTIFNDLQKNNYIEKDLALECFEFWNESFKNKKNLKIYNSEDVYYFYNCDLENEDFKYIKLYITFNKLYLKRGAKLLFDFLEKNDIKHNSKIMGCNLILRIKNIENTVLISDFVESSEYLKEASEDINCFCFVSNKIGYAYDGLLSYNVVLSEIIYKYIEHIYNSNIYKETSFQSFRLYLNELYQNYFITKKRINDLSKKFDEDNYLNTRFVKKEDFYLNYMEVLELIIASINPKNKLEDFYKYYSNICSDSIKAKRIECITNLKDKNVENLVKDIVIKLVKGYGYNNAVKRFERYIETKNLLYISKSIRKKIVGHEKQIIDFCINNYDKDVNKMFKQMVKNKLDERKAKKEDVLIESSIITYNKYVRSNVNINQLIAALEEIKINSNYDGITKDCGARQLVSINIKSDEIDDIIVDVLKKNGYELSEDVNIYKLFNEYIGSAVNFNFATEKSE